LGVHERHTLLIWGYAEGPILIWGYAGTKRLRTPGLVDKADGSQYEVAGSNSGTVNWMGVSDAIYYIKEIKVAKWGTP
jgi:hypothetical protein